MDPNESSSALPNNLENFPIEILLRIFGDIDDIGLLNLSINSCRFEKVAKIIFTERYGDKYFTIDDESDQQREIYEELFSRFGSRIKAIKMIGIRDIDETHWMAEMFRKHTNRLEKFFFHNCSFKNAFDMLVNQMDITHLTIIGGICNDRTEFRLPKYQNLRKLELRSFHYSIEESLEWIILHNSQLESLILHSAGHSFTMPKIMEYVHSHLENLKEFKLLNDFDLDGDSPSNECIEQFINVTSGLESLGLITEVKVLNIFRGISSKCGENIKNLELYCNAGHLNNELLEIANLFPNVETLSLVNIDYPCEDTILALIGDFLHLKHLCIAKMGIENSEHILSLVKTCGNLERLVIEVSSLWVGDGGNDFIHNINANFHSKFMDAKQKANVEIELRYLGRTIGRVNRNEIVWRKKRLHWIGYDPIYSKSKLNLLDLANQNDDNSKQKQITNKNPFDLILGYLDLTSLFALHNCNKRSKQLIEQFAQRYSQQQGQFIITNEFHVNYSGLKFFAKYVNNLEINLIVDRARRLGTMIRTHYKSLKTLCFRVHYNDICYQLNQFIFPNVEHFIFYGYGFRKNSIYNCNVTDFPKLCPHLKTLELRTVVILYANDENNPKQSFRNLQTFEFKPYNECQVKFVRDLFKKSNTKIVILD